MSIFQAVAKPDLQFLAEEGNPGARAIEEKFRQLLVDFQILQAEHLKDGDAAVYILWPKLGRVSMAPDLLFVGQQTEDNTWLTPLAGSTAHLKKVVPDIKASLQDFVRKLLAGKVDRAETLTVDVVLWNEKGKYA